MFKTKIIPALVLSASITLLSSSFALAGSNGGEPTLLPAPDQPGGQTVVSETQTVENPVVMEKQREIDQYVFEQHRQEIEQAGFTVTHTGPMSDYVEVGISPYTEENANYLYKIFGKDMVKVVAGQQAVLYSTAAGAAADSILAERTAAPVIEDSPLSLPVVYTAGGVITLGILGLFIYRRLRHARN